MRHLRTWLCLRGAESALHLANVAERWGFPGVARLLRIHALRLIFAGAVQEAGRVVLKFI